MFAIFYVFTGINVTVIFSHVSYVPALSDHVCLFSAFGVNIVCSEGMNNMLCFVLSE